MKTRLICTVGTSLLGNVRRLDAADPIRVAFESQNWTQVARSLLDRSNTEQVCGAEVNSITSICNAEMLGDRVHLLFLVSDTADGQTIGEILQHYYSHRQNPLNFTQVQVVKLAGLRDDDVTAFQQEGLKNLVRVISQEVRKYSSEAIAINATGGYKAQISFAGMIGQALDIPVYYLFEKFSKVIVLPPQPVSLDLGLWLENYQLFEGLETDFLEVSAVDQDYLADERLLSMVETEGIDGVTHVELSAMGYLFHERCRQQYAKQMTTLLSLVPQTDEDPQKKPIHLREDHGKDRLMKLAEQLRRSPYVMSIVNSLPFNPKAQNPIRRTKADGLVELVLTETDRGLGLCVQTTGRTVAETNAIALHLKEKYF
jgi:putative CRISPR-associated protein (TIGR02619 family)